MERDSTNKYQFICYFASHHINSVSKLLKNNVLILGYSPEMFLAVQHAVSKEIIKQKSGKPINTKVYLQRLPQIPYRNDDLLIALERFISMIIMLCFAYSFVNTVRVVTAEKELQLKVIFAKLI